MKKGLWKHWTCNISFTVCFFFFFSSFAWAAGHFAFVTFGLRWHIPIFKGGFWYGDVFFSSLNVDKTKGHSYRVPELAEIKNNKNKQRNGENTNLECYLLNTSSTRLSKFYTSLTDDYLLQWEALVTNSVEIHAFRGVQACPELQNFNL